MEPNERSENADQERATLSCAQHPRGSDDTGGRNAPRSCEKEKKNTGKPFFHVGLSNTL